MLYHTEIFTKHYNTISLPHNPKTKSAPGFIDALTKPKTHFIASQFIQLCDTVYDCILP